MRSTLIVSFVLAAVAVNAQTPVNKTIPYRAGQKIEIRFDYPELIRITSWDKNEVSVQGTVSINSGENDDAFELFTSSNGNAITIRNEIHNLKNLPQRVTIVRDGQKIVFKSKADYKKYAEQNGRDFNMMNCGVDMDIMLDIKVPRNAETSLESVYGMVEVRGFTGPLSVDATYGGVDAALSESSTGELTAETSFGHIYTNLELKFSNDQIEERDFHTVVSAKLGTGPKFSFESKYGNVYLRRP